MELELIMNPRNFSNTEYGNILSYLMSIKNLIENIIEVNDPSYEIEVPDGFTKNEALSLEYIEDLESIRWAEYNHLCQEIAAEVYFPNTGVTSLFMETLEEIKFILSQLTTKINCMVDYDFDKDFRADMEKALKNLNYCILCAYHMFTVYNGKILACLKEYCVVHKLDPIDFVDSLYNYYIDHRPTVVLFEKYPEIALALEGKIDTEYFETVVAYSSFLSRKELENIANGKITVDAIFIASLEERMEEAKQGGVE